MHHEGHSGYLAIDIANNNLAGWLASEKPDVVMFMFGTNDSTGVYSTDEVITAYTKMVQQMRASNPNMEIIVSYNKLLMCMGPYANNSAQVDFVIPLPYCNSIQSNH